MNLPANIETDIDHEVMFEVYDDSNQIINTSNISIYQEAQQFDTYSDEKIKAETILEINEKHPIVTKLKKLYNSDKEELKKYAKILYSQARLIEGLPIDNPTEISNLICEVISIDK